MPVPVHGQENVKGASVSQGLMTYELGGSGGREVRTYDSRFDHLQSLSSVLGSNPGTFSDPRRKSSARE